jgi:hypothetical protein
MFATYHDQCVLEEDHWLFKRREVIGDMRGRRMKSERYNKNLRPRSNSLADLGERYLTPPIKSLFSADLAFFWAFFSLGFNKGFFLTSFLERCSLLILIAPMVVGSKNQV